MKPFKLLVAVVVLSGSASVCSLNAASSWTYVGLKGESITTMLPMIGTSPDGIMVGTTTGIWNYEYVKWIKTWSGLPVHDLIKTQRGQIFAAVGNGSDSDGVYIGEIAGIAEPGTLWKFSLLIKCPLPTALAFEPIEGDTSTGRLFVGNAEGVRCGVLYKDSVKALPLIAGPADPFGNTCESMIISTDDGMLYAGGRNDVFPQPGPGPVKYSWLLRGNASGLTALKKMNVTSIVEMPVQRGPDDGPIRYIAIATVDSGIQTFFGSTPYRSYHSPVQQEPVLSIVPFRTLSTLNWTSLAAATPSGVFEQCPPNADCIWSKKEGLPGSPKCLAHYQESMLWAGTDSGVYRYGITTAIDRKTVSTGFSAQSAAIEKGRVLFEMGNAAPSSHTAISVYTVQGRCVKTCVAKKAVISISGIGKGLFFYRITSDHARTQTGSVIVY